MQYFIHSITNIVKANYFETSRHADIILPPVTPLERDHYDVVFHNFAVRNYATYSEAVVDIDDDQLTDWQIYLSLAERLDKLNG
ncbi:MAG: anaerobic selenocysteine-containing dehydrogenase [Alteromonadaceae bacterium]